MFGVARNFFILALLYAVVGMLLGLEMAITKDHGQMPVHAHTMVAGWLMCGFFAFFYHLFPDIGRTRLAQIHFWLTAASGVVMLVTLYFLLAGNAAVEPVTAASSVGFFVAIVLFVWIALPVVRRA